MDLVRSSLQPITRNLPQPVRNLGLDLLGSHCYKSLVLDIDPFSQPECLKLAFSKALGLGIVGVSSIVKLPQLLKIVNSGSGEGVSFLSYLLETSSFLITLAYNARQGNPFSTYGESALIAVQNVVISALVLHYGGKDAAAGVFIAGLAAAVYAMFSGNIVDMKTMTMLQAGAGALGVASKLPQIFTIWKEGTTGQLSAFAVSGACVVDIYAERLIRYWQVFNFLIGSATRIFTTLQEVNDPLILYGFMAGFLLNAVLAGQMIYYWNTPKKSTQHSSYAAAVKEGSGDSSAASTTGSMRAKGPTTRRRG
jgi:mannose-P-dolichol utilization defect protein 1